VGKPTIFVPFPFAAEDHQKVNAQRLVEKNAACMIEDKEAISKLIPAVIELSKDQNKMTTLTNNIKNFGVFNADIEIAQAILKTIQ
jgi:UDP-N-acetylglucosamine--N-acetylmuramyl-(pentapeptide) pyrophosphoryl-undecaprenol N-acetylglucosamine transferase